MTRLGVLGWPVSHSRSPAMHNAALAALGLHDWRYQRLPVPPALFAETAGALGAAGFLGANVTIPHKHAALALATDASTAAREIGAANTLTFAADGTIAAENTDAPGLIAALERLPAPPPAHPRVLVLGAGGSARAAVWALRESGASDVAVWNRTPERAQALARDLGARAAIRAEDADLLVNCTSVGLQTGSGVQPSASDDEALNQLGLTFDQVGNYAYVVDLVYRPTPTPLIAAATAHGASAVDGLEVLVAQGALSLELWTGRKAPLEVMRRAAREQQPPEQ
ncbi:MAG TPA: shikimate dehydrogenase [Solirubrobacteraceae bacterium]|jgi:shikimate dehydrogenase|nr:shikimate dehydrogenase [Solirubrobacteraceae bacterium]